MFLLTLGIDDFKSDQQRPLWGEMSLKTSVSGLKLMLKIVLKKRS